MSRTWYLELIIPILLLSSTGAVVARGDNSGAAHFPVPEVLEPNVEFWKNIYARYSTKEVVIHDSEDLGIIYEVVHLDSLFHGIHVSERLQWKSIERIKDDYRNLLLNLAQRRSLSPEHLTREERRIAALFGHRLSRDRLRRAARNVRAQSGLRERFREGLIRSGLYLQRMREIFQEAGLPEELLALPHVESSFNYKAYSKFGAAGIWQFTRGTGRMFLRIDYDVDERLDPIRSTEAAARLLMRNYQELGSWPLAITAYNHGLYGMKRAMRYHGRDMGEIVKNYRSRSFGFASRNFYAEFIAALEVAENYLDYYGDLPLYKPEPYLEFTTPHYIAIEPLLDKLELDVDEFARLNPGLRPPVLTAKRRIPKDITIRVPAREGLDVERVYAAISPRYKYTDQVRPEWHVVHHGETLSAIARKYRVSMHDILAYNNIRNAHRIYVGQKLHIPTLEQTSLAEAGASSESASEIQLADAGPVADTDRSVLDAPEATHMEQAATEHKITRPGSDVGGPVDAPTTPVPHREMQATQPGIRHGKTSLRPVDVDDAVPSYATLEEHMSAALPEYYLEVTKSAGARLVRSAPSEHGRPPFRELDWPQNGQVKVEPEETLGHFADWLEVPTQKLRRLNGLSYWEPIQVGQRIWLTFERVTPEAFHKRRTEFHQGIEEDFYRNYYVEGMKTYRVRSGDNIWTICNERFQLPYWLVKKYNPDQDLSNLTVHQELKIPVIVAREDAEESPAP